MEPREGRQRQGPGRSHTPPVARTDGRPWVRGRGDVCEPVLRRHAGLRLRQRGEDAVDRVGHVGLQDRVSRPASPARTASRSWRCSATSSVGSRVVLLQRGQAHPRLDQQASAIRRSRGLPDAADQLVVEGLVRVGQRVRVAAASLHRGRGPPDSRTTASPRSPAHDQLAGSALDRRAGRGRRPGRRRRRGRSTNSPRCRSLRSRPSCDQPLHGLAQRPAAHPEPGGQLHLAELGAGREDPVHDRRPQCGRRRARRSTVGRPGSSSLRSTRPPQCEQRAQAGPRLGRRRRAAAPARRSPGSR